MNEENKTQNEAEPERMRDRLIRLKDNGIMTVDVPNNGIEDKGMIEIVKALTLWMTEKNCFKIIPNDMMYNHIGNEWLVTDKKRDLLGTFPKRLAKAFRRRLEIDLDCQIMGQVGDIARQHCPKSKTYYVDFVNKFGWSSGDFGDAGSCYWGEERRGLRSKMASDGFWAMRFYPNKDCYDRGLGRCWIKPVGTGAVIFNAYPTSMSIQIMARVFAFITGMSYTKIPSLMNNGDDCGKLYINGGKGQYIGLEKDFERFNVEYDFHFSFGCGVKCAHCGDEFEDEDALNESFSVGDDSICESCFRDHYFVCDECSESFHNNHGHDIGDCGKVCTECFNEKYTECKECECAIKIEDGDYNVIDDDTYCCDCADKIATYCADCGERTGEQHLKDNMYQAKDDDDVYYCYDCNDDHLCHDCEDYFVTMEEGHDGLMRCPDCHEKWLEENPEPEMVYPEPHDERLKPTPIDSDIACALVIPEGQCPCSVCIKNQDGSITTEPALSLFKEMVVL